VEECAPDCRHGRGRGIFLEAGRIEGSFRHCTIRGAAIRGAANLGVAILGAARHDGAVHRSPAGQREQQDLRCERHAPPPGSVQ